MAGALLGAAAAEELCVCIISLLTVPRTCTVAHCTALHRCWLCCSGGAPEGERAAATRRPSVQELAKAQHGVHQHDELEQERQVLRELHARRVQHLAEKE